MSERLIRSAYVELRRAIQNFELMQRDIEMPEGTSKRLDKATVLLKVGAKLVKKELRLRGVDTGAAKREATGRG